jgi:hypothetical protein
MTERGNAKFRGRFVAEQKGVTPAMDQRTLRLTGRSEALKGGHLERRSGSGSGRERMTRQSLIDVYVRLKGELEKRKNELAAAKREKKALEKEIAGLRREDLEEMEMDYD